MIAISKNGKIYTIQGGKKLKTLFVKETKMEINLKFEYKDLEEGDIEILLQKLQENALERGGMVYSITKIKDAVYTTDETEDQK